MSATRSRHREPAAGGVLQQAAAPVPHGPGSRRWLGVVGLLTVTWSLALLLMDVFTAGRPAVGPGQIMKADAVVAGTRVAVDSDRILVERVFKGEIDAGQALRVVNLADVRGIVPGRSYLFALTRFRDTFEVTKLDGQRGPLLVYPLTPETIEQTKAILRDAGRE